MKTQTQRVLDALRKHPAGITAVDFSPPNVIDGGPPIMRVPARVGELERMGHKVARVGRRDKCQLYKLVSVVPGTAVMQPEQGHATGPVVGLSAAVPEPTQPELVPGQATLAAHASYAGDSLAADQTPLDTQTRLVGGSRSATAQCAIFDADWEDAA